MTPSSPSHLKYAHNVLKAKERYDKSGDNTIYLAETSTTALTMFMDDIKAKNPANKAIAAAAVTASGLQSTIRYLIEIKSHYFKDPHENALSHHDVVNNLVAAVKATADDELEPLKKVLRTVGLLPEARKNC